MVDSEFRQLTAVGRSALAVFLVDGPLAMHGIESCFLRPVGQETLRAWPLHDVRFGRWRFGDGTAEEVVLCRIGESRFELHCHGGRAVIGRIASSLRTQGLSQSPSGGECLESAPNKCTARAAWTRLPFAPTAVTAGILLSQARGALDNALRECATHVAADRIDEARRCIETMLAWADVGAHLTVPFEVVVAGPPNAGKSSLVNRLLGYDRSIVDEQAGTTRDVLHSVTACGGFAVTITDVAGLRSSARDAVEAAGIQRAIRQTQSADLVIWVEDGTGPPAFDELPPCVADQRVLRVANKSDLRRGKGWTSSWHIVSALTGDGVAELWAAVEVSLIPAVPAADEAVPFLPKQVDALRDCLLDLSEGRCGEVVERCNRLRCGE